jgi:histidinol-phosphate aminotransferase
MTYAAPTQVPHFLKTLVGRRIRQDVQSMHAYAIQDSAGMVKLDAMENPFQLLPELQAELGKRLGALAINRYPDGRVNTLREVLAQQAGMPQGYDIMLGNGSDELISLLSLACAVPQDATTGTRPVVLAPTPGFVMYAVSAQLQGQQFVGVPLTADFELDTFAMLQALVEHQPALVYLAYPNNPTANLWDEKAMLHVIAAAAEVGSIVVIDEAYQPFSSRSFMELIARDPDQFPHVLLMRTLSKFGLAGVRLGYMMGRAELISQIDKVRPPYNVSVLNYECALFALAHAEVFAKQAAQIRQEREQLQIELCALSGVRVWPSEANMILIRLEGAPDRAAQVFEQLRQRRVLVKNVSKMHSLLHNCLRLTVGTPQENVQLLTALKESL